ncbi:hypothetical protein FZC84_11870 [Rossellomorea vietnamensis]|uniref:Uncharacterized protein n=1 Tax=Rossellomorea vietnamensis TaxID=218284 RepID=A0A5D4MC94_9BACI|nr:hypothetical protein [Rossellomorea vietnamensis]TYR99067.1 hypothetical protein FZC84_11870 [Rossellomorea vietnamensis]
MKQVYRFDENGVYIEPVLINDTDEIPEGCLDVHIPEGFYQPRWNGTEIVEGLPQEEIDWIRNNEPSPPPSYEEVLAENMELKERLGSMEFAVITLLDRL